MEISRNKHENKEPVIKIVSVRRPGRKAIKEAIRRLNDIPAEQRAKDAWNQNGRPRTRTDRELQRLEEEAFRYGQKEFYRHKSDFRDALKLAMLINTLVEAHFEEHRGYLYLSASLYQRAADFVLNPIQLNKNNVRWASSLTKKAKKSYIRWAATGYGGDEFRNLGGDINDVRERAFMISKLKENDLKDILNVIDSDMTKYGGKLRDFTPIPGMASNINTVEDILIHKFKALLILKITGPERHAEAARILTMAAETALIYGSKEWSSELAKSAEAIYSRFSEWQERNGMTPDTQVPGTYDYALFNDNLAKVLKSVQRR